MRVVVDPNVLLSALIAPGGASDKTVRALATGVTLIVSEQLLDRFVQRASGKRFRRWFSVADARELADRLSDLAETVIPPMTSRPWSRVIPPTTTWWRWPGTPEPNAL